MNLLLSSNSTNYGQPYLSACRTYVLDFLHRHQAKKIVFVPYAGVTITYEQYTNMLREGLNDATLHIENIATASSPIAAIEQADAIIVGGGNTFHLTAQMYENGLMEPIRAHVAKGGLYIGWSAGANLAGPTIKTTNDMPIVQPQSFHALGLVPFQINPHYTDKTIPGHNGESRDQRLKEFLIANPSQKVVALEEGAILEVDNGQMRLIGSNPVMKLFTPTQDPRTFSANDAVNFLLV